MLNCPACGSEELFRSHSRGWFERARRILTNQRAYRCRACGWRGWRRWSWPTERVWSTSGTDAPGIDLSALDEDMSRGRQR